MDSTPSSYSSMEPAELEALRESERRLLDWTMGELKTLRKKFRKGYYDRQTLLEQLVLEQSRRDELMGTIAKISGALEEKLQPQHLGA